MPSYADNISASYVGLSTVEDLSYTPSADEQSRDVAQIAATGRRSWKTLKGKGEAVWPPNLEAALIEGAGTYRPREALQKYKPSPELRSSKSPGRFPMRNRFISDYIFDSTGKRRTPKQVGSRLQQMRDTCKGEEILNLICRPFDNDVDLGTGSSNGSPVHTTSPLPDLRGQQPPSQRLNIWVDIVLDQPYPRQQPLVNFVGNRRDSPLHIRLAPLASASSYHASLPLSGSDPTINFMSPYPVNQQCTFSAFVDTLSLPIHSEVAPMSCLGSPMDRTGWLYSASLSPKFWKVIFNDSNPMQYTIVQNIFAQGCPGQFNGPLQNDNAMISILYQFKRSTSHAYHTYSDSYPQAVNSSRQWTQPSVSNWSGSPEGPRQMTNWRSDSGESWSYSHHSHPSSTSANALSYNYLS
ncbi:hypothetical protein DFS33DRAFT_1273964 [Desarmillaria ectypa]|nr:hypothetical protein DFS33DRAFT_1273964 [Desarmillaria ectypa]